MIDEKKEFPFFFQMETDTAINYLAYNSAGYCIHLTESKDHECTEIGSRIFNGFILNKTKLNNDSDFERFRQYVISQGSLRNAKHIHYLDFQKAVDRYNEKAQKYFDDFSEVAAQDEIFLEERIQEERKTDQETGQKSIF